eukprot:COSAG03_NODE_1065_length_4923_cov_17.103648_3_plen_99_part_00
MSALPFWLAWQERGLRPSHRGRPPTSTHYLGVHEPAGGAAARARIIIQIQRSIPRLSAQHLRYGGLVAMGGRGWRGAPAADGHRPQDRERSVQTKRHG